MSEMSRPRVGSAPTQVDVKLLNRRRQRTPSALQSPVGDLDDVNDDDGFSANVVGSLPNDTRASRLAYNRTGSMEASGSGGAGFYSDNDEASRQRSRTRSDDMSEIFSEVRRAGESPVRSRLYGSQSDGEDLQRRQMEDSLRRLNTVQSNMTPSRYRHQRHEHNTINFPQYLYRGVMVLRNALDQEYDMFDVIPDEIDLDQSVSGSYVQHHINNIDLAFRDVHSKNVAARPHSIAFYYYMRAKQVDRYDCIAFMTFMVPTVMAEMNAMLQHSGGDMPQSFDTVCSAGQAEITTTFVINHEREARSASTQGSPPSATAAPMLAIPTIKQIMVRQELPDPSKALTDVTFVTEPRLSTKSLQNFWFRLEIEKRIAGLTDDTMLWSPFTPAEQHISMSDSHFYIEQEISLESFSILQGSPSHKGVEMCGADHVYAFRYFVRERTPEDSSLFCMADIELSLAEVVEGSFGFQRSRDRFKLEKYVAFGRVRVTFHMFVREELSPRPESSEVFASPERGNWLLERVSIGIRVT